VALVLPVALAEVADPRDPVVAALVAVLRSQGVDVAALLQERIRIGTATYGVPLDSACELDWDREIAAELADAILYRVGQRMNEG
jgi:hypothetical protein